MSSSAPSPGSSTGSPPSPPNQSSSPPAGANQSPPPTASSPPPQGSPPPPTLGQNSSPPPSNSSTTPPSGSSSSSPPPASNPPTGSPPPTPPSPSSGSSSSPPTPAASSNPPPSPPPSGSGSSKSPPPSNGNSPHSPPPQSSPTSPKPPPPAPISYVSHPPPAPNSYVSNPPPASPSYSSPPTSSPNSPAVSPPLSGSPPAGSIPTPAATYVPPPPVSGNWGSPPTQTTSPPSAGSPPNAVPYPQTPGSPSGYSNQNPTPSYVTPSASTPPGSQTLNQVPKLSPPSSSTPSQSSTSSGGPVIGITVAGVVIIAFVAAFFVVRKRRKKQDDAFVARYKSPPNNFSGQPDGHYYHSQQHTGGASGQTDAYFGGNPSAVGNSYGSFIGYSPKAPDAGVMGAKSWFSYEELTEITNGFSRQNILGEGGFGCVYKGWLPDGRVVAVKQLKAGSGQGEREFRAEVEIISRVHHRHLVSLVGYCIAEHHRLLVYEFVPNQTLEHHLHGKGMPVMEWSKRVKIALGSARGLAYLHEDCHPKIIHRDIKSANILLDDVFEAQVADFGLAKLTNDTHTHVSTRVMGTFGYMAPEYASSGKLTDRSDVFSFGVVLLELLTGRKPIDATQSYGDESLVEWARPLLIRALDSGDFEEIADPRLENRYVEAEMFRLIETAAACVRHSAQKRPRMAQVVRALDTEGEMGDLSNGVKYGQSTVFEAGQYAADMQRFRRMAFGSDDTSSEYSIYSGENNSREVPIKSQRAWSQNGSSEFSGGGRFMP